MCVCVCVCVFLSDVFEFLRSVRSLGSRNLPRLDTPCLESLPISFRVVELGVDRPGGWQPAPDSTADLFEGGPNPGGRVVVVTMQSQSIPYRSMHTWSVLG